MGMETPRGKAILIPRYEERNGILDHSFIDASEGGLAGGRARGSAGAIGVGLHHDAAEAG
jgi:hypothetical protein